MTNIAVEALIKIRALRKYPVPATQAAIEKILRQLNLTDLASVTVALDAQTPDPKQGGVR